MKSKWLTRAGAAAVVGGLAACGSHRAESGVTQEPLAAVAPDSIVVVEEDGVFMENGGIVIAGRALEDGPGTVLAAMSGKIPSMRVHRSAEACPEIMLRNAVNFKGLVNPHVYVDGTRSTDTCVLDTLRTSDVDRVEVYSLGFTTRPGYGRSAHGLILVFMRSR
jgi:hypothetical protein